MHVMRLTSSISLAVLVAMAGGCAPRERISCAFDLEGPRADVEESAWLGARLVRDMPQPGWAGQRKLDWSRSGRAHDYPESLWPRELRAQEARWRDTRLDLLPTSPDPDGIRGLVEREPGRGPRVTIGFTPEDLSEHAVADPADGAATPFLIVASTDPGLASRYGPGTFLVCASDDALAVAASEFLLDAFGRRTLLISDGRDARMKALAGYMRTALRTLGGEAVAELDAHDEDLTLAIARLARETPGVHAVYLAAGPETALRVLPRIRAALPSTPILASDALDRPEIDQALAEMGSEIFLTTQAWLGEDAPVEAIRFASYYRMTYQREPTTEAALAYDAARLAMFAIVKAQRADPAAAPTDEAIARVIGALVSFPGATGRISYRHGPLPTKDVWIVRVGRGPRALAGSVMADRRKAYGVVETTAVLEAGELVDESSNGASRDDG